MRLIRGLVTAFSTYSRIPMPPVDWSEENRGCALYFLPLVGAAAGGVVWFWLFLCKMLEFSSLLQGTVAAALPVLFTGGIHMDGFLDASDALASWQPPAKRLEIMKDSHVGAGAVTACCLYLLLSAGVLGEASDGEAPALALCFVASRAAGVWTSVTWKTARPGGMLDHFTHTARKRTAVVVCASVLAACAVLWMFLLKWKGALPLLALGICVLVYRRMARRAFGGVTGDLAGWLIQVSELSMLAAVVIGGKLSMLSAVVIGGKLSMPAAVVIGGKL